MNMNHSIKAILVVYTAARDRNGNCYHAARYTDCATGASVRFGNIGGSSNMNGLPGLLGIDLSNVWQSQEVLPIRQWGRLTKDWPYIANHADDKAAQAVRDAIAEVTA